MSGHWGELPVVPDTESGIAAIEREQITKPRPMEVEGPPLHQPSSKHCPATNEPYPAQQFVMDPITLHTIKLIQYSRKLRSMINNVQQQFENLKTEEGDIPKFPSAPTIPEFQGKLPQHLPKKVVPFLTKDPESKFTRGIGSTPPEIDSKSNRKLLRRSVSALCAHAGFDNCAESILETLTDICQEYFLQITQLLRQAVDNEAIHGDTGFADPMERVFHEMGIGSPTVLHEYHQDRIINYHQNMLQTCTRLREEYEKVRSQENRPIEDIKPSIKEEPLSDIQFPTLDDGDENGETDHVLHLEGLGLEINIVNGSSSSLNPEEDSQKWSQPSIKTEPCDTKFCCTSSPDPHESYWVSTLDSYDQEDPHNMSDTLGSVPSTPVLGSIPHTPGGDSVGNPGSVSVSDIMSPPSIGLRKPPKKKKKR